MPQLKPRACPVKPPDEAGALLQAKSEKDNKATRLDTTIYAEKIADNASSVRITGGFELEGVMQDPG